MWRFWSYGVLCLVVFFNIIGIAHAQDPLPAFRYVATQDTDFDGTNLSSLIDTNLQSCNRACSANSACTAFTYNRKKNSCFAKAKISGQSVHPGMISAHKVMTAKAVIKRAVLRAKDLKFLSNQDRLNAYQLARDLGLEYPAGDSKIDAVLSQMDSNYSFTEAGRLTAVAVSLSDRADLWVKFAGRELLLSMDSMDSNTTYAQRALSAAINGYLRAEKRDTKLDALDVMARTMKKENRGRDLIAVLRLSVHIQSRPSTLQALEKAEAKYGFRVISTSVESDPASPRICASFSENLVKNGVDYEPYVQRPDPSMAVQINGDQLCIDGLAHGKRYRLILRKGLPAADGEKLYKDVPLTQYVRDRSPSVHFPGRAYVLPRVAAVAVPIDTVNVSKLDLVLRRVSDRNLIRSFQKNYFARSLSSYDEDKFSANIAQTIWTGSAEINNTLNHNMTTRLPLTKALAGQKPGIYVLTAQIPDNSGNAFIATQWLVLSDLGLSSMSGTDGLHISIHGLSDAQPRAGIAVTLISQANTVLGKTQTDAKGDATFAPGLIRGTGSAAPALILAAQGNTDFAFLSLRGPSFDLSDRGVAGRAPAGPVDVFMTTDRGAYRPGETINATILARDDNTQAIDGLPLIISLNRPDGVEYRHVVANKGDAGGHVISLSLGADVPHGSWQLQLRTDPKGPVLASRSLLVEDFLPERIDFKMTLPKASIHPTDSPSLTINARYFFGAPGADLSIDGEAVLRASNKIAAFPGYEFGRYDAKSAAQTTAFGDKHTDAKGQASEALTIPDAVVDGKPMQVTVTARLADGSGRPVERRISAPVLPSTPLIGVRKMFDEVVPQGQEATFKVIGLSSDLKVMPMKVKWTLNKVQTDYQWYRLDGNWRWEPTSHRTRVSTGKAMLGKSPLTISQPVGWGEYELVVERIGGSYTAAATDFYAGWYASADSTSTPDRLQVSLDRPSYHPGDTARLLIKPRIAGMAMISVLSNKVIERKVVQVKAGEVAIPLKVTKAWGAGVYVTAMVIRPLDAAAKRNPTRALGLVYAKVDPGNKLLKLSIDVPKVTQPRRTQMATIQVKDAKAGDKVWLTLAAVDVGILNLTGFKNPDPVGYYFGQRRLGVELRDIYGRLIDGMNGAMGIVHSGGDAAPPQMHAVSPPPTQKLMSAFSGLVKVAADGTARVAIKLPAFNGTVRLMAVAWSANAVGQASTDMIVRDPVVVTAITPRFLAPGDDSRLRLQVVHADGPTGQMNLSLHSSTDALKLGKQPGSFNLKEHGKAVFEVPLHAVTVGNAGVDIDLTTADGHKLSQHLTVPVRANDPPVAHTRRFVLDAGNSFAFSAKVFAGLRPGSAKAILSAGPLARLDVPGLLSMLDSYSYGCTEQITSKTLPLLYLSSVSEAIGLGSDLTVKKMVNNAIRRILTRQSSSGAFGLWAPDPNNRDFWLDAYVSDFLSRARAQGYKIPEHAFTQAMDNLRNKVNYAPDFDSGGEAIAYALMVLAREHAASVGDLRYYADAKGGAFTTPLAAAQLGAALAFYGDQTRADAMFIRAAHMLSNEQVQKPYWRNDYGTTLRDRAGLLALLTETGSKVVKQSSLIDYIAPRTDNMSTQEASWSLLAAQAMSKSLEQSGLSVNGAPVSGPMVRVLSGNSKQVLNITAAGDKATNMTLTTVGVPKTPLVAGGTGYTISRNYYTMAGKPLKGDHFSVGERFVTVLTVSPFKDTGGRLIIDDPLPAGLEIDNPSLLRSGDVAALKWLNPNKADHAEFRSDRFLAAVVSRGASKISFAYVARAVTPGSYHHPAASVEDMYRPRYRGWTASGQVVVDK